MLIDELRSVLGSEVVRIPIHEYQRLKHTNPQRALIVTLIATNILQFLFFFLSLEYPLNTILIKKLSIASHWHVMQLLKPFFVCSVCQFVKHYFQLLIRFAYLLKKGGRLGRSQIEAGGFLAHQVPQAWNRPHPA